MNEATNLQLSLPGWPDWKEFVSQARQQLTCQKVHCSSGDGLVSVADQKTKTDADLKRFLNRLLGTTALVQTGLFELLTEHVAQLEDADRREGNLDDGVVSLNHHGKWGKLDKVEELHVEDLPGSELQLRTLRLYRGLSWERVQELLKEALPDQEALQGLYFRPIARCAPEPVLIMRRRRRGLQDGPPQYTLHYPQASSSTLLDGHVCTAQKIRASHMWQANASEEGEIESTWRRMHDRAVRECIHVQRRQRCHNSFCQTGMRCIDTKLLTGAILSHWRIIAQLLSTVSLVRVLLNSGRALVGLLVADETLERLRETLARRAQMAEVNRTLSFSRTNTNSSMQFDDAVSDEGDVSPDEMMLLPERSERRIPAPKFPTRKPVQPEKPKPRARVLDVEEDHTPKRLRTAQELAFEAMQEVSEMRKDVGDVQTTSQVIALDSDEEEFQAVDGVPRRAQSLTHKTELVTGEADWLPKLQREREAGWLPKLHRDGAGEASSVSQDPQRSVPSTSTAGASSSVHPRLAAIKARIQERLQGSKAGTTTISSSPPASETEQSSVSVSSNSFQNVQAPPKYRNEIWFRKN